MRRVASTPSCWYQTNYLAPPTEPRDFSSSLGSESNHVSFYCSTYPPFQGYDSNSHRSENNLRHFVDTSEDLLDISHQLKLNASDENNYPPVISSCQPLSEHLNGNHQLDSLYVNPTSELANSTIQSSDNRSFDPKCCINGASQFTTNQLKIQQARPFYCREWVFDKILRTISASTPSSEPSTNQSTPTPPPSGNIESPLVDRDGAISATPEPSDHLPGFLIVGGSGSGRTSICNRVVELNYLHRRRRHPIDQYQPCPRLASETVGASLLFACLRHCHSVSSTITPFHFLQSFKEHLLSDQSSSSLADQLSSRIDHSLFTPTKISQSPDQVLRQGLLEPLASIELDSFQPSTLLSQTCHHLFLLIDDIDDNIGCLEELKPVQPNLCPTDSLDDQSSPYVNLFNNNQPQSSQGNLSIAHLISRNLDFFPPWLCLILTCRRNNRSQIIDLFPGIRKISIDDLHRPAVLRDVQQYLSYRLANEKLLHSAFSGQLHSELFNLLRIKSSACMLYLETVLDAICERWLLPNQIANIPGTLNGLFLWICQNSFDTTASDNDSVLPSLLTRPILEILLASSLVLSELQLYLILKANQPNMTYSDFQQDLRLLNRILILSPCHLWANSVDSSVARQKSSCVSEVNGIHFFHSSFAEWLLDVKHCGDRYCCSLANGQSMLETAFCNSQSSMITSNNYVNNRLGDNDHVSPSSNFTCDQTECVGGTSLGNDPSLGQSSSPSLDPSDSLEEEENLPNVCGATSVPIINNCRQHLVESTTGLSDPTSSHQTPCKTSSTNHQNTTVVSSSSSKLVKAARDGDVNEVVELIKTGGSVDELDEDGWSALRTAAWRGNLAIVNVLLEADSQVNLAGPDGRGALRAAAWAGHEPVVSRLIEAGANVNQFDKEGRTPLIAAAYMGHAPVVDLLLQSGANVNHADEDGRTALHVASFCVRQSEPHQRVVACLLDQGADPSRLDCEGISPLLGAARVGNAVMCELCLEADSDVNQVDSFGNSALVLAVLGGHVDVVRLLLFWGAAVDLIDPAGRSLLSLASAVGSSSIVHELLARGLDEGHRDHLGCSPLHLAASGGMASIPTPFDDAGGMEQYCEVVRLLVDSGAHIDALDNAGRTPLLAACEADCFELVELLLAMTSSPTTSTRPDSPLPPDLDASSQSELSLVEDDESIDRRRHSKRRLMQESVNKASLDNSQTPLRCTALQNNHRLVQLLLASGADPDHQDSYGRTTLYLLALEGMFDMARLLLLRAPLSTTGPSNGSDHKLRRHSTAGANPVLSDDEGRCPLHVATWQGHFDMVRLLLQAGTPVDIRDREGRTPLQLAAWQGHAMICRLLLGEAKARVDAVCSQGATSLCIAAQEGHFDVCVTLLQNGANPYQADSRGRTPYRVALRAGHLSICQLLDRYHHHNQQHPPMQQQHRPLLPVANNLMLAASTTSSSGHFGYTNSSYLGGDGSPLNADLSLSSSSGGGGGSALMTTTPSGAVVQQSLKNNHHQPTSKSRAGVHSITPGRHQPSQPVNRQSTEGQSPVYQDDADPYARPPGPMAVKSRSNHQHQLSSASTVTVGINDDGLGQSRDQLVMPTTLSSNPYNTELSLASTANSHFIDSSDMSGQQHQWSFPPQHSHQQQSTSRQHQPPHHPSRQRRIRQNVVQQPPQYDTPPIVYARQPQLFTNGSRNGDDASLYQGVPQGQWPPSSSSSRRRHPQQPSSSLSIQSASSSSNTSQSVAFANNRLLVNGTNQSAANWAKMHHQQSGGGGGHLPINHHHAANLPTTTRIPDLLVHQQNVKSSPKRSPQPPINNIAPSSPRGGDSRHHLTAVSSTSIADLARKSSNKTTVCAPRPIDAVQRLIGQFASSSSDKRQAKQHASQSRVRQTTAAARSGSKTTKPGASDSRNVDQDDERETTALCLTTGDLKLTNTKAALAGMLGIGGGGGGAKRKARRKLQQASNVDKS